MLIPDSLTPVLWTAAGVGVVAAISLAVGITLLLGAAIPHRKVALPIVWISASALVAALTALILILTYHA